MNAKRWGWLIALVVLIVCLLGLGILWNSSRRPPVTPTPIKTSDSEFKTTGMSLDGRPMVPPFPKVCLPRDSVINFVVELEHLRGDRPRGAGTAKLIWRHAGRSEIVQSQHTKMTWKSGKLFAVKFALRVPVSAELGDLTLSIIDLDCPLCDIPVTITESRQLSR
jgi:hypothetical protein